MRMLSAQTSIAQTFIARTVAASVLAVLLCCSPWAAADSDMDPLLQARVNAKIEEIREWAADEAIVSEVRQYNSAKSPQAAAMDQAKWAGTSVIDPFVRGLTKTPAAAVLKTKRGDLVAEAFLSGADGGKVAFLGKPSRWSHKGNPKHDRPMSGKTWQGDIELDESSGLRQLQVAVPVLEAASPSARWW
jgi:hypothetical protein